MNFLIVLYSIKTCYVGFLLFITTVKVGLDFAIRINYKK
jgi:hypothetical protein